MSWRLRRTLYLMVLGAFMFGLALYIYIASDGADFDILATIGVIGGLAVLLVSIPESSDGDTPNE